MDHRTVEALARETAPTIDDTSSQLAIVRHHLRIDPAVAISYLFGCA